MPKNRNIFPIILFRNIFFQSQNTFFTSIFFSVYFYLRPIKSSQKRHSFSTSTALLFAKETSTIDDKPVTPTGRSARNTPEASQKTQFSAVNIKVKPKSSSRSAIDYSQSYTANNFITTVRAFNEFLLRPK